MRERLRITKLPFVQEGPVAPKAPVPIMIYVEEGYNLNVTILQLKKEEEELEKMFTILHVRKINWIKTLM